MINSQSTSLKASVHVLNIYRHKPSRIRKRYRSMSLSETVLL